MPSITQNIARPAAAGAIGGNGLASRFREAVFTFLACRRTRHVVQSLSDDQLRDCGIDRAAVVGGRPVIDPDTRLTTYLASLR